MTVKSPFAVFFAVFLICITFASGAQDISEKEKRADILKFGLATEITSLLSTLITEKNTDFMEDIEKIFYATKNVAVRDKIIQYFIAVKSDVLKDYAITILEDPYDQQKSTVNLIFTYVTELRIKESASVIVELLKSESEEYQGQAIRALGKVGGADEALFLTEYLERDLPLAVKQSLVSTLGELQAVETWDALVAIAENKEENSFMRSYAAEAIGRMKKAESVPILIQLFEDTDPTIRAAVVRGLACYDTSEANAVIIEAFKDSYYKVRIEAAEAAKNLQLKEASAYLIYRAKNDPEKAVKSKCYEALAVLNTSEGSDYLFSLMNDSKLNESIRAEVIVLLLQYNFDKAVSDVISIARETLKNDKVKNLRYSIGKELAKYESAKLSDICGEYISHADISTKGIGLDIYEKNTFASLTSLVKDIASNDKMGSLQSKAKRILEN